jgi:hypothetical protein
VPRFGRRGSSSALLCRTAASRVYLFEPALDPAGITLPTAAPPPRDARVAWPRVDVARLACVLPLPADGGGLALARPDPAAEVQMAGRIHRLGQSKDVLIKRFIFRATVEEHIDALHQEMRKGRVAVTNGCLPRTGIEILRVGRAPC